jgi:capsular exopolysaccharide synthesis family protein
MEHRSEFLAAQAQERSLMGALDQQKSEALGLNRKGIDYGVLQRDAATNRQVFEGLLQRTRETGISRELKTSSIRIVDGAEVPRGPARPKPLTNLPLGLFGGGMLALGLAFFFEYLDNRIKSPDEIKLHLALPFLGMVPAISGKQLEGIPPLLSNGAPANFAEAFHAIRTNVLFSSAEEGAKSIVITSTGPGEGKTVVAANLALALAQAGQRVLLLDADMRQPRIHELFRLKQEPGLSNVLVGKAKASEAVKKSGLPGLWIMPSGTHPPNPSELLGSGRFRDFVVGLREHFDWVLFDSPPVMAVTDATVLAHWVTGVLFVVGAEMTSRQTAQVAIENLEAAKGRLLGAILNRVAFERHGYYYSHYYRREYSHYYSRP